MQRYPQLWHVYSANYPNVYLDILLLHTHTSANPGGTRKNRNRLSRRYLCITKCSQLCSNRLEQHTVFDQRAVVPETVQNYLSKHVNLFRIARILSQL